MKKLITNKRGQASLEFFLMVAFITVALVFSVKFFFPGLRSKFSGVGSVVELAVETGSGFN